MYSRQRAIIFTCLSSSRLLALISKSLVDLYSSCARVLRHNLSVEFPQMPSMPNTWQDILSGGCFVCLWYQMLRNGLSGGYFVYPRYRIPRKIVLVMRSTEAISNRWKEAEMIFNRCCRDADFYPHHRRFWSGVQQSLSVTFTTVLLLVLTPGCTTRIDTYFENSYESNQASEKRPKFQPIAFI